MHWAKYDLKLNVTVLTDLVSHEKIRNFPEIS